MGGLREGGAIAVDTTEAGAGAGVGVKVGVGDDCDAS